MLEYIYVVTFFYIERVYNCASPQLLCKVIYKYNPVKIESCNFFSVHSSSYLLNLKYLFKPVMKVTFIEIMFHYSCFNLPECKCLVTFSMLPCSTKNMYY